VMDHAQIVIDMIRMVRRRFLLLLAVSLAGIAGSVYFALLKPPVYETSAKILIESQQIADNLARSTVNLSAAERVQLIEQQLVARNNLIDVIERFELFADLPLTMNEKIDMFREAIQFETISVSGQTNASSVEIFAFTINARLGDAEKAADVVNDFVDSAIEQNLRVRADRARDTFLYFEREAERVEDAIAAIEAEIGTFKHTNEAALPENLEYRRDEMVRLQESDMEIARSILELDEERGALELALAGDRPLRTEEPMPQSPEETAFRTVAMDLAQKRRQLAPNHPEIRRLENSLLALTDLIPASSTDTGVAAISLEGASNEQRSAARRHVSRIDSQVALLEEQRKVIAERREALSVSIQRTPEVEVNLNALNRRLREMQDQYTVITSRRAEARTGEELENSQQSERFKVVESALVPDHPVEPKRKRIVALGSGGSIAVGFALILLLEMMRPVLRSGAQMERELGLRPVISIPYVATGVERRRRRLAWLGGFALLLAGVILALVQIDARVMPLEELQQKLAQATGIKGLGGAAGDVVAAPSSGPR
jgi:uncharacterized protein involved in exopolysaccharide biosynthesis